MHGQPAAVAACIRMLLGGVLVEFDSPGGSFGLVAAPIHHKIRNEIHPEFTIHVLPYQPGTIAFNDPVFRLNNWEISSSEGTTFIYNRNVNQVDIERSIILEIDPQQGIGKLYIGDRENSRPAENQIEIPPLGLDEILAVHLLSMGRGLMFHASGISTQGNRGLLFAGYSGAGKSTIANLWVECSQGAFLGDERIAVRRRGDFYTMQGTAWHGKGRTTVPGEVPLTSLFIIQHSTANWSRRLSIQEASSHLLPHAFLPNWNEKGMAFSLRFLEDLCTSVPCYELGFTPNQDAVDYVKWLISS